ncbi:MAG: OsmC family protein [Bacteroidetes bacterium]|nr:OsmC family protein [Bacteroidota bacterium]
MELEGRVLVVKRIHVNYYLRLTPDKRDAALRAHAVHASSCPMFRSVGGCIDITTELQMEDLPQEEF